MVRKASLLEMKSLLLACVAMAFTLSGCEFYGELYADPPDDNRAKLVVENAGSDSVLVVNGHTVGRARAFDDEDSKGAANGVDSELFLQSLFEFAGAQTIHFHVYIFCQNVQQAVAHAASNEKRAPTCLINELCQFNADVFLILCDREKHLVRGVRSWKLEARSSGVSNRAIGS